MCWRSGTSMRREPASWANTASRAAGSGAVRKAIAAIWANGLGSAHTARMPWATARRAVQPVPAHGSSTVSPAAAKAESSASIRLSAGEGKYRSRSARPGRRRGRTTCWNRVRSASLIGSLRFFDQLLFELGLCGVLREGGVELLDLLGLVLVIVAERAALHVRSDATRGAHHAGREADLPEVGGMGEHLVDD